MASIVDVAARAGVSTATVSRVLNGKTVRADLTEAVLRAAEELQYSPNRAARSLRRRHSEVIALILPDIENPFFTSLARGVEDAAQRAGLSVVLCNTDDDPEKESRYLRIADSENMTGVILAPANTEPDLGRLADRGTAIVVVDREVGADVDHVLFDNRALGRRATEDLIRTGCTRIACVTGPATTPTAGERASGWRDALEAAGLPADDALLVYANFRVDGGRAAMSSLLALPQPPDAVLATNNLVGVGVLQVVTEGRDELSGMGVGVIGEVPFVTSAHDNLTVHPLGPREMGLTAARLLLERIAGSGEPARRLVQDADGATVADHTSGASQDHEMDAASHHGDE
jgi:LacI family transcriptional regulator